MAMVYATGHLSGAHLNPAVTLAFALTRHFPAPRGAAYVGAQIIGALPPLPSAGGLAEQPGGARGPPCPRVGDGSALVYEAVLTALLMFVIMAVATDTRAVGAGSSDRDRRHGRARRALRRPDHRRLDEPGPLDRARARLRRAARLWIYLVGADRSGRPWAPLPTRQSAVPRCAGPRRG